VVSTQSTTRYETKFFFFFFFFYKKNSDFTRVGTNFVYNLQGRKESKISGDVNRREFQGSVGSEASEGKSEGGKFRGEKIQRSV
jgi:hypothetical protein